MEALTLEQAKRIIVAALEKGAELRLDPLSVAMLSPPDCSPVD